MRLLVLDLTGTEPSKLVAWRMAVQETQILQSLINCVSDCCKTYLGESRVSLWLSTRQTRLEQHGAAEAYRIKTHESDASFRYKQLREFDFANDLVLVELKQRDGGWSQMPSIGWKHLLKFQRKVELFYSGNLIEVDVLDVSWTLDQITTQFRFRDSVVTMYPRISSQSDHLKPLGAHQSGNYYVLPELALENLKQIDGGESSKLRENPRFALLEIHKRKRAEKESKVKIMQNSDINALYNQQILLNPRIQVSALPQISFNGNPDPKAFSLPEFKNTKSLGDNKKKARIRYNDFENKERDKSPVQSRRTDTSRSVCVGLRNLGNTCFMNAILQCLFHCPSLFNYFNNGLHLSDLNVNNPLGCRGEIASKFGSLVYDMLHSDEKSIEPYDLKYAVGEFQPRFKGYRQHDAAEFLNFLLDGIHEDLNRSAHKRKDTEADNGLLSGDDFWARHLNHNQSVIVDTFHGQLVSHVQCSHCRNISSSFDPFAVLALPIRSSTFEVLIVSVDLSGPLNIFSFKIHIAENSSVQNLKCQIIQRLGLTDSSDDFVLLELINLKPLRVLDDKDALNRSVSHYGLYFVNSMKLSQQLSLDSAEIEEILPSTIVVLVYFVHNRKQVSRLPLLLLTQDDMYLQVDSIEQSIRKLVVSISSAPSFKGVVVSADSDVSPICSFCLSSDLCQCFLNQSSVRFVSSLHKKGIAKQNLFVFVEDDWQFMSANFVSSLENSLDVARNRHNFSPNNQK